MSEPDRVIDLVPGNLGFAAEVAGFPGGEAVRMCFHCGTCSAGCPVREVNSLYNPRNIMRLIVLGMKDAIFSNDFIWLCSSCYGCQERCPQGVKITDIMTILRNMAVRAGHIHPTFRIQAELLGKFGRLYEVEDFDLKKRKKFGLPPVQKTCPEVGEIFRMCGLEAYVART